MQRYFFSIIIPTRKLTDYLLIETLPAIEKQTYRNFEVIILADNPKSFQKIQDDYKWLKVIKMTKRPGEKRDYGAKIAKGTILSFIDDDVFPPKEWLKNANKLFNEYPQIASMGGPGILPRKVTTLEQIFDLLLLSWLGSGSYTYRFQKEKPRFVEDYPSMNLMMKKEIFEVIGGFNSAYWPGEDSKLTNTLFQRHGQGVYYHPDLYVYHHRRTTLKGHLTQYRQYGTMRGTFFAHGDKNSSKPTYLVPSGFFLYVSCLILYSLISISFPFSSVLTLLVLSPLIIYLLLLITTLIITLISSKNIMASIGMLFMLPLTHLFYGYYFIKGYLSESFKSRIKA